MLLDRLEDAGLVQHVTGRPPDRRAVTITLTDPGRHDLDTRLDRADQHLDQFRSAFPAIDPSAHSPNGAGTGSQQH